MCSSGVSVFGIYPDSTSPGGSFRNLTIVQQIAHHNTAVMAAHICRMATTDVCNVSQGLLASCCAALPVSKFAVNFKLCKFCTTSQHMSILLRPE
jgi:hypothetical protein